MRCRSLKDSDIPKIREMFDKSGFSYDFPDLKGFHMECVRVICDENDEPIMAAAAESIPQLYLWCGKLPPAAMARYVRVLHESMANCMKKLGYTDVCAALPPEIDSRFGRWLQRRFGWKKSWSVWSKAV